MKNIRFFNPVNATLLVFVIIILISVLSSCTSARYSKPAYTYKAVECAKF